MLTHRYFLRQVLCLKQQGREHAFWTFLRFGRQNCWSDISIKLTKRQSYVEISSTKKYVTTTLTTTTMMLISKIMIDLWMWLITICDLILRSYSPWKQHFALPNADFHENCKYYFGGCKKEALLKIIYYFCSFIFYAFIMFINQECI